MVWHTNQIAMNNFKGKFMSTYRLFLSTLFKPLCEHKHMAVSWSKYEQLQQLLIDNKGVKHWLRTIRNEIYMELGVAQNTKAEETRTRQIHNYFEHELYEARQCSAQHISRYDLC